MLLASGGLRPGETGAKMRATGGIVRQQVADGLRKQSSRSFGPAKKPGIVPATKRPALLFQRRPQGIFTAHAARERETAMGQSANRRVAVSIHINRAGNRGVPRRI